MRVTPWVEPMPSARIATRGARRRPCRPRPRAARRRARAGIVRELRLLARRGRRWRAHRGSPRRMPRTRPCAAPAELARGARGADGELDGAAQPALVGTARAAVKGGVAEVVLLHAGRSARARRDGRAPRRSARRAAGSGRPAGVSSPPALPSRASASRRSRLHHPHDPRRDRSALRARLAAGRAPRAEGYRGMRPLGGAALRAARRARGRRACGRGTRAGRRAGGASVYVRPMSTPAWSSLPPMPMPSRVATYVAAGRLSSRRRAPLRVSQTSNSSARRRRWRGVERRRDRVVGVCERARDLPLVQVRRAQLDVAAVGLQPLVVLGADAVAEHVHRLRLAAEARR